MASSLIIVGLAAAWLAVLVPMVAKKRQVITQTNDAALAARVVRRGSARGASSGEDDGAEHADAGVEREPPEVHDDHDVGADDTERVDEFHGAGDRSLDLDRDEESEHDEYSSYSDERAAYADEPDGDEFDETGDIPAESATVTEGGRARRYRPGRGGFDPEAAALVASAKYAFRQRVVIALLFTAVGTAVAAAVVLPVLWWAHGAVDVVLVGYLVYLRRQVRIEEEIRQRRLARLRAASRRAPRRPDPLADIEVLKHEPVDVVGSERKPMPTSRVRRQAVVVDLEDEDPAFHELDEPAGPTYRRAAGE